MSGYIIEHPTKGVLMSQDYDPIDGDPATNYKSVWSWSKPRAEACRFDDLAEAATARRRLADAVAAKAYLLHHGNWSPVVTRTWP